MFGRVLNMPLFKKSFFEQIPIAASKMRLFLFYYFYFAKLQARATSVYSFNDTLNLFQDSFLVKYYVALHYNFDKVSLPILNLHLCSFKEINKLISEGMPYIYLDRISHIYLALLFPNIGITKFVDWVLSVYF